MTGLDTELFLAANKALSGPLPTRFFEIVTYLGNGLVLAILILPAFYFLDRTRFRGHALAMALSIAFSGLLVNLAKIAVDRPRPPEYFAVRAVPIHVRGVVPDDRSFPSGHAQTAFGAAVYLSCLYGRAAPAFLIVAALVGLSRVALGVHFPFDVAAGALIGALFSILGYLVARRAAATDHLSRKKE